MLNPLDAHKHSTQKNNQNTSYALAAENMGEREDEEEMVEQQGDDSKDSQVEKRLLFHFSDYEEYFRLACLRSADEIVAFEFD